MGAFAPTESVVAWADHEGPLVTRRDGLDIIACKSCGFRHAVPLPDPETLEKLCRERHQAGGLTARLNHTGGELEWAEMAQSDRLDVLDSLLANDGPKTPKRFLDVGSGSGTFLKTARERGWSVLGIDPSHQACVHARSLGLDVMEGFFNAETLRHLGRFDVMHLNNLLEHVPNPQDTIGLAYESLNSGGVLCLNAPNEYPPFQEAARVSPHGAPWGNSPLRHLNYFDFESLSRLVSRAGFAVRERMTSFPTELFLLMGIDYAQNLGAETEGLEPHTVPASPIHASGFHETRRAFYHALAQAGMGREAVIIAVKK